MKIKYFILFYLFIELILLSSCFASDPPSWKYKGNNLELQVIATNSLLGVQGTF